MKKTLILAVLTFSVSHIASSQVTFRVEGGSGSGGNLSMGGAAEQKEIGRADLECFYDYRWLTDVEGDKSKEELMVLQVGAGMSKFYSYRRMQVDSLIATLKSPEEFFADPERFKGGLDMVVYKNYPAGKVTFTDKIGRDWFIYEEDNIPVQWEVTDEEKTVEGYLCRKATCTFRGRDYIAWFTPEIPVGEGPWKFSGLPGLILDVADTEGHYSFSITGIRQVEGSPVYMAENNYQKTDRKQYLKTKERFETDPLAYMTAGIGGNAQIKITTSDGMDASDKLKPKPLKYEYQERDYK